MGHQHLSPAETARRLGVSVRALRLYERRGLVRPHRTEAGWRVYGPAEIERLHRVLALKSLGLTLVQIAGLLHGQAVNLDGLLALQEIELTRRAAEIDRALKSIGRARAKLADGQALSLDDLANLSRETQMPNPNMDPAVIAQLEALQRLQQKHLSPEQYEELKARGPEGLQALGLTYQGLLDAWKELIGEATRLMELGAAGSPEAARALRRWLELARAFTKGDPGLEAGAAAAYQDALADPAMGPILGVSKELFGFMGDVARRQGAGRGD